MRRGNQLRYHAVGVLSLIAVFFTFLLPLKFGSIACIPERVFFPTNLITWFIFIWPPSLFPLLSSLFSMAVVAVCPPPHMWRHRLTLVLVWTLLGLVSIIGFLNASVHDFPLLEVMHFSGIALFGLSIFCLIETRPEICEWLFIAIILGVLLSAILGFQQYWEGFEATKNYVYQQELRTGLRITGDLRSRIMETRVFSTFALCNSFAAHLILTIPLCIWGLLRNLNVLKAAIVLYLTAALIGAVSYCDNFFMHFFLSFAYVSTAVVVLLYKDICGKIRKILASIMCLLSVLLLSSMLYYTGSRAAIIAFGAAAILILVVLPFPKKVRVIMACLIPVITVFFFYTVSKGRNIASLAVRFDYFLASLKMFAEHPFSGTGWGDFFHEYTRIKLFPNPEAPHSPHNFIMDFTSQTGFLGLLISSMALFIPLYIIFCEIRKKNQAEVMQGRNMVILLGWFAWGLHALADINSQIPGSVATGITMLMLMSFAPEKTETSKTPKVPWNRKVAFLWYFVFSLLIALTMSFSIYRIRGELAFCGLQSLCEPNFATREEINAIPFSKVENALASCRQYMPYSPFPWASAGNFAEERGFWGMAEQYHKKAIELSPERSAFYYRLYITQMILGKKEEAKAGIKKARELFPNNLKYRNIQVKQSY